MTINIGKYQSGGGLPPFVSYTPVTVNNARQSIGEEYGTSGVKNSSSDDTKGEITNKDLLSMLKDIDGLPSDMEALYKRLNVFYRDQELGLVDTKSLSTQYLRAIQQIKTAKYNKEVFDTAYKELEKNGGLNEVAISSTGKLIGINSSGNLKQLSLDEAQNTNEYQIMTNAELLQYRAEDPSKAGMNDMLKFASNGIGMEQVNKLIGEIVGKLGTTEVSKEGVLSKEGQTLKGLQVLQQAYAQEDSQGLGVDGLYKSKILTKSQAEQAQKALYNVFMMLPQNAKTLLLIKGGGEEGAQSIVNSIISAGRSDTYESSFTPMTDSEGKKLNSNGGVDTSKVELNTAMQFIQGLGYNESFVINDGSVNGIALPSSTLGINKKDGTPLGTGSTLQEISSSQFGPVLDFQNATMDGYKLSDGAGMRVLTDGQAHSVDLPLDMEAYAKNQIKPDLNVGKKIEQVEQYIRENHITDYQQINKLYQDKGIPAKYKADGTLDPTHWGRFAAINATALNSAFKEDVTFSNLEEVDDENESNQYLEQLRKANNWNEKDFEFDKKSWADKLFGGNDYDAFYRGVVYIPIKANAFNALGGTGTSLSPIETQSIEALEQQKQRIQNYRNPGSFK